MADLTDMPKQFKQMTIDPQDINILLMGETGVGKSTFINAFANYMEYDKFNVAERSKVCCLIPSSFTVIDENMQEKLVKIGQDKNENEEVGVSATQGTRSYVFPLSKYGKRVRLIDTPGVGDTRGIDRDAVNFENILTYISNMEYLHAICFLLKPNNSRLTVYFEYCIKQLLSRLEKSAGRNIIFLFTYSRSTFYRPGDTAPALKKILDQIRSKPPNVDIKFEKDNVFCLDNEAFRFMVSYKEGIRFTSKDKESFSRSWEHSVAECWRMIEFITGVGNSSIKLVPHKVQDTISVNHARRIVLQLSQPLADIADLINDNINLLDRHNVTLAKENVSMTDLKNRLYVPVVNLRHKELKQPTTVCTNAQCSEIYMVAGKKKYHYKQRCHDPCYLTNVPAEIIGSPELTQCWAISRDTKKCTQCSCDFSSHMHIYYLTETYEDKITDTGIQSQITDRETAVKEAQKLIKKIELRKLAFEEEKEVIVKNMAKFAHFLQRNAIAPYNDAYKAYIEYLIDRENSFGPDADNQLIIYYQDLLKRYDEEKQILDNALQMSVDNRTSAVTSTEIFQAVQTLFDLKYTGKKIQELHDKQTKAREAEFEDNTEYVLDAVRNINPSIKGVGKRKQKPFNKRDEDDGIPSDMKEKLTDLFQHFPEMEEYFEQRHRAHSQKSTECLDEDDNQQRKNANYKNQKQKSKNAQGAYKKNQQNNPPNQKGQGNNNYNKNQNYGQKRNNYNQDPGNSNQGSRPYNQGQNAYNQNQQQRPQNQGGRGAFNQNQGQRPYNQGHGPRNQHQEQGFHRHTQGDTGPYDHNSAGPGFHNQRPESYNQGPRPYSRDPESYNQPPGPYNERNQGPGPYNQGPGPYNQAPGSYSHGPGPLNQGPGFYSRGPGSYNQAPGPYNQGPGPYNQGPGPYSQRQQPFNNQGYNQNNPQNFPNQAQDLNLYMANDDQKNSDKYVKNMRPSGPYQLETNDEKAPNIDLRHMNKFLNDCEVAQENPGDDDADFDLFMKQHGLDSTNNQDANYNQYGSNSANNQGGNYVRNQRGGGPRGRGGRFIRGGGRGRGGRRSKSNERMGCDSESDSGQSYSSRGTNKSNRNRYKKADNFEFIALSNQERNAGNRENSGDKKGVLDFLKAMF